MATTKIRFVLNEPRNPKNIGAAARGMANFGFRDLAVVNPYSVAWREIRSAVNASDVVKKAKRYKSLKEALRVSHLVIGTSTGSRRAPEGKWIETDQLKTLVHDAVKEKRAVSILFGSEKRGLSNEDLAFCHYLLRIPTVPDCPSMNLSQAVAIVAFVIRLSEVPLPGAGAKPENVSVEHRERLIARGHKAFSAAGLLKGWDSKRSELRLRKAIYRWDLTETDIDMLHGVFSWVIKKTS